nr:MAG TPA: hypothetical protein [Microviridae sp.]
MFKYCKRMSINVILKNRVTWYVFNFYKVLFLSSDV